jgi:hypothetical protein
MLSDKFRPDTSGRHGSSMPRIRTAESRRFGTKWDNVPVALYELETRNPSRLVLLIILQCYPTSFFRTQATDTVPACQESGPQYRAIWARNGRTYQSLRTSSKQEILRGWYSRTNYNAIQLLSSGHKQPTRFWPAKNPDRRIVPLWHEMGEHTCHFE